MPGACEGVITVTAIDQEDGAVNVTNQPGYFSNYLYQFCTPVAGANCPPEPTPNKANLTVAAPGARGAVLGAVVCV